MAYSVLDTDIMEIVSNPSDDSQFAQLYLESCTIHNFRGLMNCHLEFERDLTLLVGRNNAGKTRILRALEVAFGHPVRLDDLTVGSLEPATIEIVIAPAHSREGSEDEEFDESVVELLGRGAMHDLGETRTRERFAWRTTARKSDEGLGAQTVSELLNFNHRSGNWELQESPLRLSRRQSRLFSANLVRESRDLGRDLSQRGSAIRRILSDLEIDEAQRSTFESQLEKLSKSISRESDVLQDVLISLKELETLVGTMGSPEINPLPSRLEELFRSVAIDLDTGNGALPIRLHGAGARSLASLQIQGVNYRWRLGRDGPSIRPFPITLVEEPEAHLHPQAELELGELLAPLPGQVIASTHSVHLVTSVDGRCIRLLRQEMGATRIIDLEPDQRSGHRLKRPVTHGEEIEKLKRLVERPFGELLFANAVVMGDGATERAFLPALLRHALGARAHGVCVIDPGSLGTEMARAVAKFADLVNIPCHIYADSDKDGRGAVGNIMEQVSLIRRPRVTWIGGSKDANVAFEKMMVTFDKQLCLRAVQDVRPDLKAGKPLKLMTGLKGSVGVALARRLIDKYSDLDEWPDSLKELINHLKEDLDGSRKTRQASDSP